MMLPLFTEKICSHRGACAVCRNELGGADWRAAMEQAFVMPAGWPVCPIGLPMGATAEDVRASVQKPAPAATEAAAPSPWLGHGVGSEIAKLVASWGISDQGCGSCKALARQWDSWGIAECERKADELRATLVKRAFDRKWTGWVLGPAALVNAGNLIRQAIEKAKADPLAKP